jgi:hypothetical protein
MALSGVVFTTTIPPGLVILLVPAGLVAVGRWRWPSVLAVAAAPFIVVGYLPSGAAGALLDPTGSGAFLGLWLQFAGASVALVAGTIAVARTYRASRRMPPGSRVEREGTPRAHGEHDQLGTVPRPYLAHRRPPPHARERQNESATATSPAQWPR